MSGLLRSRPATTDAMLAVFAGEATIRHAPELPDRGDGRKRALAEYREVMEAIEARDRRHAYDATRPLLDHSATDLVVIRGRDPFAQPRQSGAQAHHEKIFGARE